nr:uncharacterized protein LOC109184147 [Ipomoea batatas]
MISAVGGNEANGGEEANVELNVEGDYNLGDEGNPEVNEETSDNDEGSDEASDEGDEGNEGDEDSDNSDFEYSGYSYFENDIGGVTQEDDAHINVDMQVKLRFGILGELEDDLELEKSISFVPHLRLGFCLTDAEMVGDDEGLSLERSKNWNGRREEMVGDDGEILSDYVLVQLLTWWNV